MRRFRLAEIGDQAWCPALLRDGLTDFLRFNYRMAMQYEPVVPLLAEIFEKLGTERVVDLCSGSGGPWPDLLPKLARPRLRVLLTDRFPNIKALQKIRNASGGNVVYRAEPVDAMHVPPELSGFRTLFTGFHHFDPEQAKGLLRDAVAAKQGIGIFEYTERSLRGFAWMCLSPLAVILSAPFIRPFRWSRLPITYLLPVLPLTALLDGLVSCLRTYSCTELSALISEFAGEGYAWRIGTISGTRSPLPVTYLIGYPEEAAVPEG